MLHIKSKLSIIVAICLGIGSLNGHPTSAELTPSQARRLCRIRTGLIDKDIETHKIRNENCSIDCITKQGTIMTAYNEDGTKCHTDDGTYKCVLGKCRNLKDKADDSEIQSNDLNSVELRIKSAFVADRDPYPTQGESDAFVVVELVSNGGPSFKDGEVICYTHVVQDTSRPRWNFSCKPQPLQSSARLRFVVLDSDKPDTDPQLLGRAVESLESLMNTGTQKLTLEQPNLSGGPYWLEVELVSKKYEPIE